MIPESLGVELSDNVLAETAFFASRADEACVLGHKVLVFDRKQIVRIAVADVQFILAA